MVASTTSTAGSFVDTQQNPGSPAHSSSAAADVPSWSPASTPSSSSSTKPPRLPPGIALVPSAATNSTKRISPPAPRTIPIYPLVSDRPLKCSITSSMQNAPALAGLPCSATCPAVPSSCSRIRTRRTYYTRIVFTPGRQKDTSLPFPPPRRESPSSHLPTHGIPSATDTNPACTHPSRDYE